MTPVLVALTLSAGLGSALLTNRSVLLSRILKIIASTAMISIVAFGDPELTGYAVFITVGLGASWIGDLALSFDGRRAFLAGLVSFALAHLAYIAAFFARSAMDIPSIAFAGVVMAVTAAAILRWLSPHVPDDMATPVSVYVGLITVMVVASFGTSGTVVDPRIPTAAVLFMISDVLVARQQFLAPMLVNRIVGLPIYYAAQALFAVTVVHAWL